MNVNQQKSTIQGNGNIVINSAPKYVFCGVLMFIAGVLILWLIVPSWVHMVMILMGIITWVFFVGWIVHWLFHQAYIMWHERKSVRSFAHVQLVGEHAIGDSETVGYRNLSAVVEPDVKDETLQIEPTRYESGQIIKQEVRKMKDEQGLTMQQIVDRTDLTMYEVRKALGKTGK